MTPGIRPLCPVSLVPGVIDFQRARTLEVAVEVDGNAKLAM